MVDNVPYNFLQFHYHSPSEHTVDGKRFPLEVHFVHQNADGGLAVFGILYDYSTPVRGRAANHWAPTPPYPYPPHPSKSPLPIAGERR